MVSLSGRSGLTIFFTGLSGAGKTTLAEALQAKLGEIDVRPVRLLDGDVLRRSLSSELGFSREHRDLHVVRVGHVAAEITACGAIAVCAVIAPYETARTRVRAMIEAVGTFVLVHVSTPLEVCEQRDVKGLYAKARAGQLTQFTGISDPYEVPHDADFVIDTTHVDPSDAAGRLISRAGASGMPCREGLRHNSPSPREAAVHLTQGLAARPAPDGSDDRSLLRASVFLEPERMVHPPSWLEHIPFAFWVIDVLRPRVFVELGTHSGNSYGAFAQAVQHLGLDSAGYAVDTWKGDAQAGFYDESVFVDWKDYHDRRYSAFSTLIRSTFDDAAAHFSDGSVDLLHIDGSTRPRR